MLLDMELLAGIREGRVDHILRRWTELRVRVPSQHLTPVGVIAVLGAETVPLDDLTPDELASVEDFEGSVYRLDVRWVGEDPRIALRQDTSEEAVQEVVARLRKKDARAERPWTTAALQAIADRPETRAADLAEALRLDKATFKRRVRQLKAQGLTISLEKGYRLSPRGEAVLAALSAA